MAASAERDDPSLFSADKRAYALSLPGAVMLPASVDGPANSVASLQIDRGAIPSTDEVVTERLAGKIRRL